MPTWKRGDLDPETGLLFWQKDPASKGGARWYTAERFAEVARRKLEKARIWLASNRSLVNAKERERHSRDPERNRARTRRWKEGNLDRARQLDREWKRRNPEKIISRDHRRRAKMLGQLHPDHDMRIEHTLQGVKRRVTECLGIQHHLDHIVPLGAGGWHHHLNLQVIPAYWNLRKNADPRFVLPDCYARLTPATNTEVFCVSRK